MRLKLSVTAPISPITDGLYWAEAIRCGSWEYPDFPSGGFDVNESIIDELATNFKAGEKGPDVPLNYGHDDEDPAGWVKQLVKRGSGDDPENGSKLFAGFEILNPDYKEKVDLGLIKYVSSEIDFDYVNPETCRTEGDCTPKRVFEGLALCLRPYIKGMQPIMLCEPYTISQEKPGCKCGERRNLNKEGYMPKTIEQLEAELAETKAKLAENSSDSLKAQLAEEKQRREANERQLREVLTTTRLNDAKTRLSMLVAKRKLTPAIANRALRLCQGLIVGGSTTINLNEKVKVRLADNTGDEEIDKLDVVSEVLDMLQELPDALSSKVEDANLEEEESDDDMYNDDDKAKMSKAKIAAHERVVKGGVTYHVALAEELKKVGITSAFGGKKK